MKKEKKLNGTFKELKNDFFLTTNKIKNKIADTFRNEAFFSFFIF